MAIDVKTLRFTLDEYKQYRTEDAKLIKKMGIRIKDLEATAKQNIIVNAPIQAEIRDTLILRDTISQFISTVKMKNPHLTLNCIIENDTMKGTIVLPVNLHQAIWVEYKHRFLWWRWGLKVIHQSVRSDNPYVRIKYSEYIYMK
jgi:hypothetical protein